jgi:hypothetical protein
MKPGDAFQFWGGGVTYKVIFVIHIWKLHIEVLWKI